VVVAGAGDCLRCFAALIWRGRMLVSLEGTAVESWWFWLVRRLLGA